MNIFYLHNDYKINARYHLDKHIVKMPIEYAQLLSTAHRLLDGQLYIGKTNNGRKIKRWYLQDKRENLLYKASHVNHPSAIWTRASSENYKKMYQIYWHVCKEYEYRYNRVHGSFALADILSTIPSNIEYAESTEIPQCMPEYCKIPDCTISAYRKYYNKEKNAFAKWKNREIPYWYNGV